MRLLLDLQAIQTTSARRGIGRYALCLARALVQEAGHHQVEVLLNGGDDAGRLLRARSALETFLPTRAVHVFEADWPWHHRAAASRRELAQDARLAAIRSLRPDAVLIGSVFEGDTENVLSVDPDGTAPPTAAILYDLMPAQDPETYLLGPGADIYWRRYADLQRMDLLLAISRHSASGAQQVLGAACPRTVPVWGGPFPAGAFPLFEPGKDEHPERGVPGRFLLTVGGDHHRKNLDRLVEAFAELPVAVRCDISLIVACRLNAGTVRRLRRLAGRRGLPTEQLVLLGEVSETTLDRLYREALAFVFPSVDEGLGMPPLEAMARGCPTVMARGSSLSELSEAPTAFFDGTSTSAIGEALRLVLTDQDAREGLRAAAAASAATFTWERSARLAWRALEEMASAAPESPTVQRTHPWPLELSAELVRALPQSATVVTVPDPATAAAAMRDAGLGVPLAALAADEALLGVVCPTPPGLRTALAPARAIQTTRAGAELLLSAGVVHTPLITDTRELPVLDQHDPLHEYAELLAARDLDAEDAGDLLTALTQPARWTLQRPQPVWLLLTNTEGFDVGQLRARASSLGAALVVGDSRAVGLAASVDEVLVEGALLEPLRHDLVAARCRGAHITVVDSAADELPESFLSASSADGWAAVLSTCAARGRGTGWPWRD